MITTELTGKLIDCNIDFVSGQPKLTLAVNEKDNLLQGYDDLKDKELSIKITQYRKKRSLDANAYFWVLCGKLALKTRQNKTDIYKQLVREIGDNFVIVPIRNDAVNSWCENWSVKGLGWICELLGDSKIEGYTNVCCYYGSSTYNTEQMSALLDSVIFECKEQGIETMTPNEIERLKAMWGDESEL